MKRVLVVDDARFDRELVAALLRQDDGYDVTLAGDGDEALRAIPTAHPQLVLTDLQMPGVDGLALTRQVRDLYPGLPVVLMTAHGSEETAAAALRAGAAGYVPKRHLSEDLLSTIEGLLALRHAIEDRLVADHYLMRIAHVYVLDNDRTSLRALSAHLVAEVGRLQTLDEADRMHLAVALVESLTNAIEHGNLEIDSRLREEGHQGYAREIERRRALAPYRDRRVRLEMVATRAQATFVVQDEGPGFDRTRVPDPRDPDNIERVHGRGLLLIDTFMDEVRHNAAGNQITFVRRARGAGEAPAARPPREG